MVRYFRIVIQEAADRAVISKRFGTVQNTGNCKWDEGYQLAFIGGDDELNPHSVKFLDANDFVDPGATADLGLTLTAPKFPGKYTATWKMQADNGAFFGTPLTVLIEVKE